MNYRLTPHVHPRSLDAIAREIPAWWRRPTEAGRIALADLRNRPLICEALYPRLAVRAVWVFLESSATWRGKHAARLKAELLDQVEQWEAEQAEINQLEKGTTYD